MALVPTQVSLLVGANGFGYWHYRTADLEATVHGAGYFNGVASMLNVGDFICLNAGDGNQITSVTSITAGVVVIGAGTAVLANAADMQAAKKAEEAAKNPARPADPAQHPAPPNARR